MPHTPSQVRVLPIPFKCVQARESKWFGCHAGSVVVSAGVALEVNLRIPLHVGNEPNPDFEIQAINLHQKSNTEVPVADVRTF